MLSLSSLFGTCPFALSYTQRRNNMNIVLKDQDTSHGQTISEPNPSRTTSLQGSKPDKRILVLDGVRAIACLGVLSFHLSYLAGRRNVWKLPHDIHDVPGMLAYSAGSL